MTSLDTLTDAEYRHLLQKCEREIAAQTNLQLLLPLLITKGLLVDEEFRALQELASYERGSHLVQILQKKGGEDAFNRFIASLKQENEHLGHKNLASRLLREKEEVISSRPPVPRKRTSGPGFRTPPVAKKVPMIPQANIRSKSLELIDEVGLERDSVQKTTDPKPIKDLLIDQVKQNDVSLTREIEQLGRDLKSMKDGQEVFHKSLENKVGTAMEAIQDQVYALTTLVKSLKHDDKAYEWMNISPDKSEAQLYDDVIVKPAVNNDYVRGNQYYDSPVLPHQTYQHPGDKVGAATQKSKTVPVGNYMHLKPKPVPEDDSTQYEKPQRKGEYVEIKIVAQGVSGEFWLAVNKVNDSVAVIKKPKVTFTQEMLGKEVSILVSCRHPNIIKFITANFDPSEQTSSLVFEYAEKGKLKTYLQEEQGNLNSSILLGMATNVACGMMELAHRNIVHCDLQASNILIDSHQVCKIASFHKAQRLKPNEKYRICDALQLAIRWQPPEVLTDRKFSLKSDAWSFGVFLAELFTYGGIPYDTLKKGSDVKKFVLAKKTMLKPNKCPGDVYSVMKECFHFHPDRRFPFTGLHKELRELHSVFFRKLSGSVIDLNDEYL